VPVVSAVGPEIDVSIYHHVADQRAPTPSAAAEAVVPDGEVVRAPRRRAPGQRGRALRRAVERREGVVAERLRALTRSMERRFAPVRQGLDRASTGLERGARRAVERRRRALATLSGRLDALSPLATLGRGYSVARTAEGEVLRSVADLPAGRAFRLRVTDGSVSATSGGVVEDGIQTGDQGGGRT
jgi:exodeoxyribonuclease VII large subunit